MLELLRQAEQERDWLRLRVQKLEKRLAAIRPLRETERRVLYAKDDVLNAARRLSKSFGEINTTAELDRALRAYDEAVAADREAAKAGAAQ